MATAETLASIRDTAESIRRRLEAGEVSDAQARWLMRNRIDLAKDANPWWAIWRK